MVTQSSDTNNRHSIAPTSMEGQARESKGPITGGEDWTSPDLYNYHQASTILLLFYFISFLPFLVDNQVHHEAWRRARERWGEGRPVSLGSTGWGGYCCCSRVSRRWQRSPLTWVFLPWSPLVTPCTTAGQASAGSSGWVWRLSYGRGRR